MANAKSKEGAKKLSQADRRAKVLTYRMSGASSRDIAVKVGVSHPTVLNDLKVMMTELNEQIAEGREQLHALENSRLDKLQAAIWLTALTGHPDSVRTVLSVMERRAKLNGLDKPVKIDLAAELEGQLERALTKLSDALDEQTFKRVLEVLGEV